MNEVRIFMFIGGSQSYLCGLWTVFFGGGYFVTWQTHVQNNMPARELVYIVFLQEHQSILTNTTVSKDSEIGILMVVYENFFY